LKDPDLGLVLPVGRNPLFLSGRVHAGFGEPPKLNKNGLLRTYRYRRATEALGLYVQLAHLGGPVRPTLQACCDRGIIVGKGIRPKSG
jgi:hypothetical protein